MKSLTVKKIVITLITISISIFACQKKPNAPPANNTFDSLNNFLSANAVQSEFFNIDAVNGGSFTSTKGTKVTIKANSLIDNSKNPITGTVKVEFKDIYSKSDMLLSQVPAMLENGAPLISAGEFFINLSQNNVPIIIVENKPILVQQPLINGASIDTGMKPFIVGKVGWTKPPIDTSSVLPVSDSLNYLAESYVFSIYQLLVNSGKGTWCNSDNSSFFASYKQTELNIISDFTPDEYDMSTYLIFKNINSMIYFENTSGKVTYPYAPIGLSCTIVVVGTKGGNLYSSFTDITISANQTVHIPISATNANDFKTKLKSLD